MKRTNQYGMVYFEKDDYTNAQYEMQRWETLDAQLAALFNIMGNGVLSGWDILAGEGLSATITAGSGHVSFVSTATTESVLLTNLTPSTRNYIYAQLTPDSYWTQNVSFVAFVYQLTDPDVNLYLGYVDTDLNSVTDVNTDGRKELGFVALINSAVAAHKHTGGTDNPSPINLATEVQGILGQEHFPELDAELIKTGTLDPNRIPLIDHTTGLNNVGTLTHAQLDAFIETLSISGQQAMGEVSTTDLLQLILALKHAYPDIDKYLVNELAFIPGISPDEMIDTVNTTAIVDTRTALEGGQHTITGTPSTGFKAYTRIWNTEDDYSTADKYNVLVDGDSVSLSALEDTIIVDDFASLGSWTVSTNDLSSIPANLSEDPTTYVDPPYSAKLAIGSEEIEIKLLVKKTFNAQDWSNYDYLTFYIKTDSVEHGDLFFYLTDANYGTQNSYTKVLNRNSPTINVDTQQNGWQEVSVDIRSFQRSNVNIIGFYLSTQEGWDTTKPFVLNIDRISLTTGNVYKENGYARVIFGSDMFYNFWRLRWDVVLPSSPEGDGASIEFRTRVANTQSDLLTAPWSPYMSVSGSDIVLPTESLYKYIQIEAYFTASTNLNRTPFLRKIYLDFYVVDVDNSFTFNTQDDWETGNLFNIDTKTYPNSIVIKGTDDVGSTIFGTDKNIYQLDSNLQGMYKVSGSLIPKSTNQAINATTPALGLVTGVSRGNDGNIWVSDTDNDRVLELTKNGGLVRGFFGSFLNEPSDPYGIEDNGPGSNITDTTDTTTDTATITSPLEVLQSVYNPNTGILYIVFNQNIENIYASDSLLDINRIYLKIGAQKFRLNDSTLEILGVDETKYALWFATSQSTQSYVKFLQQFAFVGHVLKITILGADRTALDYMVNQEQPSLVVWSPLQQERLPNGDVTLKFLVYNFDIGVGNGKIKVTIDGTTEYTVYSQELTISGLSAGEHTYEAQLINSDNTPNINIEAIADGSFVLNSSSYTLPYITFQNPTPNQIYSCQPVTVEFKIENFPVIPSGQHIRYQLDTESPFDYYSTENIVISDVSNGKHSVSICVVDENGTALSYPYGSASVEFIIGTNSQAAVKLYVEDKSIYNSGMTIPVVKSISYVDVGNVVFQNIYSPIDVQLIPNEASVLNDGSPTVLVAKLRSPSWTNGLANQTAVTELMARLSNIASNVSSQVLSINPVFEGVQTDELIYGTKYLDGHSVVQMNMNGSVIFSNNAAKFAEDRTSAKDLLGSADKLGDNELLIGDSINKRAMVTVTDLSTKVPSIIWQYDSDRYIPDFHMFIEDQITININNGSIDQPLLLVREGSVVEWINNSSAPVSIYSGTTTYDEFQSNPNLNLYGDIFSSGVLEPGESYTYKFINISTYNWFVYPNILTASVMVTKNRISSQDKYLVLENDGLESPFSSRAIQVDSWGNTLWSFGEGYLVKPRDARPMLNDKVLIST